MYADDLKLAILLNQHEGDFSKYSLCFGTVGWFFIFQCAQLSAVACLMTEIECDVPSWKRTTTEKCVNVISNGECKQEWGVLLRQPFLVQSVGPLTV